MIYGLLCWINIEMRHPCILDRSLRKVKNNGKQFMARAIHRGISEPTDSKIYDTHHSFRETAY